MSDDDRENLVAFVISLTAMGLIFMSIGLLGPAQTIPRGSMAHFLSIVGEFLLGVGCALFWKLPKTRNDL